MRANDPNLLHLRSIAEALGELREQIVFVGGAVAGLLVTDPLADSVRATRDVDAVVNASRATFHRMEEQVAERGFARDISSDVICRWVHQASGVLFDLMPVQSEVLGFSNRWYPYAVETAVPVELGASLTVRLVSAVAFVATKLEAFAGRGGGDFLTSHDLEDVLNIVNGREELVDELAAAPAELRQAVAAAFAPLLSSHDFVNVLPGLIAEPERASLVLDRLRALSR
jgi:Nucleotidyl transferase AbiEii toxin, Type IV TA system